MQKASPLGYTTAQSSVAPHVGHLSLFFIIVFISAPLCVSGLGITLRVIAKAALKLNLSGETCHAFTGISASISSYRCTFRPALVVSSPFGAFPSSASRPLRVPMASSFCLLTIARVPLSSFDIYPGNITSVHDVKEPLSFHPLWKERESNPRCPNAFRRLSEALSIQRLFQCCLRHSAILPHVVCLAVSPQGS